MRFQTFAVIPFQLKAVSYIYIQELDVSLILDRGTNASKSILAQVQRELNIKDGGNCHLKPMELSSIDEAVKQKTIGSLTR